MPTGYTADVQSGKVTEFSDFVWQCARAFGALVLMRDDPADAPIPQEFRPSKYESERVVQCRAELEALERLTVSEAAARQTAEIAKARAWRAEYLEKRRIEYERYATMRSKVSAWEPPTKDHRELKKFMLEQLSSSIDFDCGSYEPSVPDELPPEKWLKKQIEQARTFLARAEEGAEKEIARTNERNAWVKALRESVPPPSRPA